MTTWLGLICTVATLLINPPDFSTYLPETALAQTPVSQIVYVTPSGKCYHRSTCRYARKSATEISIEKAAQKRRPCKICKPPASPSDQP